MSLFHRKPKEFSVEPRILRELYPGDILVVMTPERLTFNEARRIKVVIRDTLPPGIKAMILDGGVSIEILREKRYESQKEKAEA